MNEIKFEPSKVIIVAKGNTKADALAFAKAMYNYTWDDLEQSDIRPDSWIGVMDKEAYMMRQPSFIINK